MDDTYMTTQRVVDGINHEWARLISAICRLEDTSPSARVTEEGWTTKDVLAHLVHWTEQIASGLGMDIEPPVYVLRERMLRREAGLSDEMSVDDTNELAVAHYSHFSFDHVRVTFDLLVFRLAERARWLTEEEVNAAGTIPWAAPGPLWQQIGGDTFLHWPIHSEAIERAAAQ